MTNNQAEDKGMENEMFELAKFIAALPDKDPLADIENMRRNLNRALSCARDGNVYLTEAEIKHWIDGIDIFLRDVKP